VHSELAHLLGLNPQQQSTQLEFFDLIPEAASTILVLSIIYPSFIHLIHHLDLLKDLKATGSL